MIFCHYSYINFPVPINEIRTNFITEYVIITFMTDGCDDYDDRPSYNLFSALELDLASNRNEGQSDAGEMDIEASLFVHGFDLDDTFFRNGEITQRDDLEYLDYDIVVEVAQPLAEAKLESIVEGIRRTRDDATSYLCEGKYDEALSLYEKALEGVGFVIDALETVYDSHNDFSFPEQAPNNVLAPQKQMIGYIHLGRGQAMAMKYQVEDTNEFTSEREELLENAVNSFEIALRFIPESDTEAYLAAEEGLLYCADELTGYGCNIEVDFE